MGTPAPDYHEVDYYQLNASLEHKGDSAIAVLVLRKPTSTDPKEREGVIKSCVLIDGGCGPLVAKLIIRCLQHIGSKYSGEAKLDAISLSHWDAVSIIPFRKLLPTNRCYRTTSSKYE